MTTADTAEPDPAAAWRVLQVVDLPYAYIITGPGPNGAPLGYAAALRHHDPRRALAWCHLVGDGQSIWHGSEAEAWKCFDQSHPGLRDALDVVEAVRGHCGTAVVAGEDA